MIDVVISNDRYLLKNKTMEILENYRKVQGDFQVHDFDVADGSFEMNQFIEACSTVSLFNPHTAVVINLDDIKKKDEEDLASMLKSIPYEVNLILQLTKKPLVKSPLGKAIKDQKIHAIKKPGASDVVAYLKKEIKSRKIEIQASAQRELEARLKDDPSRAMQELDKLELMDQVITKEDIALLVAMPMEENVFSLSNAVLDKNIKLAFNIYHDFLENKMSPLALMGLLASSFRRIFQISALADQGYSAQMISRDLSLSEKQVFYLMRNQLRPPKKVLSLLNDLAQIDQDFKLGKVDLHIAFEMWMYQACQ